VTVDEGASTSEDPTEDSAPLGTRPPRTVTVTWARGEHRFEAVGSHPGRTILLNAPQPDDAAATGFSPAELVLAGAGACSAWDVVQILDKARQDLRDLEVRVVGTQQAEQPWPFRDVRLHYVLTGRGLKAGFVRRAVRLSHERYCSAIATIRGVAEVGFTIEIREG
jgi:putative redox protein